MKYLTLKKYNLKYFQEQLIIHPLNIILLFFISTSSINFKADLPIIVTEAVRSILIILAFSIGIFFVARLIIKDNIKSSLFLSAFLFFALFFRDIFEILSEAELTKVVSDFLFFSRELFFVITIVILVLVSLIIWLFKSRGKFVILNSYLNLLTTIFLTIEICELGFIEITKVELKNKMAINKSLDEIKSKPDIYFIILDGYTGFYGLKKYWDFDNYELKEFLDRNGFFISENGKTVYNVTNYVIASTLNITELNYEKSNLYAKTHYLSLADIIKKNVVVESLSEIGYDFINLSFFDIRNENKYYEDIYFLKNGNIYQSRTLYGYLFEIYNEITNNMADINIDIFERLKMTGNKINEKPRFIYAHIMMPHAPYYFDASGNKNDYTIAHDSKNMIYYLEYLKYTNRLLMETVQSILGSGEELPIIVVQGDHGFRRFKEKDKKEAEYSVLSCYYFPNKEYSLLSDSTKTINTFSIILNTYFNQDFELNR